MNNIDVCFRVLHVIKHVIEQICVFKDSVFWYFCKGFIVLQQAMAKPVVFVIGASGNVGAATLAALSTKYVDKVEIRAGVRNPANAEKLKGLQNVTLVAATMGDRENLPSLFSGVDALFIVTSGSQDRAELTIATAEVAKSAGVKFILVVSVLTAELTDTIFGAQFKRIEDGISQLGVPYCILRLPYFVDNHLGLNKSTIKAESTIYCPVDPEKPFTPVTVSDSGNAAAAILSDPSKHTNKTYKIVSQRHTFNEVTAAIAKSLGRDIKYVRVTYETAKATLLKIGFKEWKADGILDLYGLIDNGSPLTNEHDLSDYTKITNEQPTDLNTWVGKVAGVLK